MSSSHDHWFGSPYFYGGKGKKKVSLVVALEASDGVVLAADTRATSSINGVNYHRDDFPKITPFGANCAVGIVGQVEKLKSLVDKAEREAYIISSQQHPYESLKKLSKFLGEEGRVVFGDPPWEKEGDESSSIVIVGHGSYQGHELSFICELPLRTCFRLSGHTLFFPVGQGIHGGLHLLFRFYKKPLSIEKAACAAYFCIREVALQDGAVGGSVVMYVVKDHKVFEVTPAWLESFKDRHEQAVRNIDQWLNEEIPLDPRDGLRALDNLNIAK